MAGFWNPSPRPAMHSGGTTFVPDSTGKWPRRRSFIGADYVSGRPGDLGGGGSMGEWVKVARLSELPAGTMQLVGVGGEPVCLVNVDGSVCAIQDTCTHEEASL